ncbi:MAG TPA: hypothetical protein VIF12_02205 [Micavibrio sp.]
MTEECKTVSIVGFKTTADEMEQFITDHAERKGLKSDIVLWGGRGDSLPYIVVVCKTRLAQDLRNEATTGFLQGCGLDISDYKEPPKPHHAPSL